ncbi:MAG: tetratricopeptide repeat protein, partial [Saprospiraceae bacterium]|nr:tetratricopeptide repeat protein [Saprospiraceae bacterium]
MRYRSIFLWLVLLFVLGLVFNCVNVWAQSPLADNLNQELEQLATDSLRLQYCLAQARSASISEAAVYLREAVKIADRIDDPKSMAELYTEKAILENKQGNHMAGVRAFMKVDSISRLLGDTAKLAAVQTNLGLSHFYAGNKDMALQHYYEAYQLYNIINEPRGFSRLLNNLAICTKELNKLDEAEKYYRESLQLKRTLADSNGIATSLMNLGLLLAEKKQYEEALATLQEARSQYQEISAEADAFACQLSEGKIMIDQGQWDRALPLVQESYDYFHHQAPESPYLLLASGDLAAISINRKDYRLANAYLEEALVLAKKSDKLEVLRSLLKDKALVEYALQDYQRGFDALQESYILNDSINAHSKLALIEEMQTRFEVDAKEREITLLNTQQALDQIKLKNSRNRNLILILVGIALSIFSAFIYRLYFQINRQKKLISQALAERETLLKEIHHRVKNNLQVISSLLSMQSYQIQDKNALEAIQESRNRVKSMSLIHQSLYQDKGLVSIDSSE